MNVFLDNCDFNEALSKLIFKNKYTTFLFFALIYKRDSISRVFYELKTSLIYGNVYNYSKSKAIRYLLQFPYFRKKIDDKINEFNASIKEDFSKKQLKYTSYINDSMPAKGYTKDEIVKKLKDLKSKNDVNTQLVSGTLYNNKEELELIKEIYPIFYKSNPLHPDVFPELSVLEKNIIQITKKLFNGDENTCGCVTSGGTESILMACYAYKNLGLKAGITNPEIILPITAHAAFDKAADYFNIRLKKIPINFDTYELDLDYAYDNINNRTIAFVCSAPSFSHGIVDPIKQFSDWAVKYNIPLHIDACLGGFILPFIENRNFDYDFKLPGVTSISADTHKYGYCPKGSSIILYRNDKYFKEQIFVETDWNGGIYATPTIMGSKPGNNIVLTWATLNYYGYNGYKERAELILNTTQTIINNIRNINEVFIYGNPQVNVIGIGSKTLDIYEINQEMIKLGWNLNELQMPASIHLCVTLNHCSNEIICKFIKDLRECVTRVKNYIMKEHDGICGKKKECSSIYGSTQKIPDRNLIKDIAKNYIKLLSN